MGRRGKPPQPPVVNDYGALLLDILKVPAGEREKVIARAAASARLRAQSPARAPVSFRLFGETYRDCPDRFARECVRWSEVGAGNRQLADYQAEILGDLRTFGRACVRGPHGLGKTVINALAVLWFALTREALGLDWKIPTTASAWRQLQEFLWPEIRKWAPLLDWRRIGRPPFRDDELQTLSLKLRHGRAFAMTSNRPGLVEGAHASQLLFVLDEAKTIPVELFDAIEGALGTANPEFGTEVLVLCTSTPGAPHGRFYEIQTNRRRFADWHVRAVRKDEVIAAGLLNPAYAEARRVQWGEASPQYINRIEGNFADSDQDTVLPLSWVEAAVERWQARKLAGTLAADGYTCTGADIAAGGGDSTAFAIRYGMCVTEVRTYGKEDTMQAANRLETLAARLGGYLVVDAMGVGAGVYDRLRELKARVRAFVGASATPMLDSTGEWGFANTRSAAWWNLRQLLDPSKDPSLALPPHEELLDQLTAPTYGEIRTNPPVYLVEPKERLIDRLGYSTDAADAVVMALWKPPVRLGHTRVAQARVNARWAGALAGGQTRAGAKASRGPLRPSVRGI